jgi:hypothetical protein
MKIFYLVAIFFSNVLSASESQWSLTYSLYFPRLKDLDNKFSGTGGNLSFGKKYLSQNFNYNLEADLYIGPFSKRTDTHGFGTHLTISKNFNFLENKNHKIGLLSGVYLIYLRNVSHDYEDFKNIKELNNPHLINSYKITTRQISLPLGINYSYQRNNNKSPLTIIKSLDFSLLLLIPLYSPYKEQYYQQTKTNHYTHEKTSGNLRASSLVLQFSTPFGA